MMSRENKKEFTIYISEATGYFIGLCVRDEKENVTYYVFHGRVTLFFANNSLMQCRTTMKFVHNFFRP